MCSLFTAVASLGIAIAMPFASINEEPAFYTRLLFKAGLFAILALLAWALLRRLMREFPPRLQTVPLSPDESNGGALLGTILLLFLMLTFPRLSAYPWTAPDELHHLSVVRNLAETGVYASGHPEHEFIKFDSYDSVGPAAIVPAAALYRAAGGGLIPPRTTMAIMFMTWLAATWLLARPVMGGRPAAVGVALAGTAIGSIYLGRTVYGEVPGLLYATAGLLYWRLALGRIAHIPWSGLAGVCFGLCVLSKTILILTVFPIITVWLFDRLSFRRIPSSRLLVPATAAACTVGAWSVYQSISGGASDASATLHLYRHYLLFGFDSADMTLGWFAGHWIGMSVILLGFLTMLPTLVLVRYDAAMLTLAMTGVFFAFWWTFFTPGQIPRYLWYTLAIGGLFAGPFLLNAVRLAANRLAPVQQRVAAAVLVVFMLTPSWNEVRHVSRKMWFEEPMTDEYALQEFLAGHADQPIVTTSWMTQRSANFFSNRYLPRIDPAQIENSDAIVIRDRALEDFDPAGQPTIGAGRYVIVHPNSASEPSAQ